MIHEEKRKIENIQLVQEHHQQIISDLLNIQELSVTNCIEQNTSPLRTPNDLYEQSLKKQLAELKSTMKEPVQTDDES